MYKTQKKGKTSKSPTAEFDEFIEQTQSMTKKNPKQPKRVPVSLNDKEESDSTDHLMSSAKKKKYEQNGTKSLVQGKLLEVVEAQLDGWKCLNTSLLKGLSEVIETMEADFDVQKKNNKKLQHLTASVIKCNEQAALSQEQKLKTLTEIQTEYKKRCEDMDSVHKKEATKLANDIENDIEQLEQRLTVEAKRSGWDNLRKTVFEAMKRDFE